MPSSVFTEAYAAFVSTLVELRKTNGLTQAELAHRLGKPQQFVSAFERRVRRLDVVELYAVLRALGADPEAFVQRFYRSLPTTVRI